MKEKQIMKGHSSQKIMDSRCIACFHDVFLKRINQENEEQPLAVLILKQFIEEKTFSLKLPHEIFFHLPKVS